MKPNKLIAILILFITLNVCRVVAQQSTAATFRARRDRVMQAAPDALVLVRSRSSIMSENEDGFRQYATFYYLTGLENAVQAVLVMDSRRHESWLFVPPPGKLPGFGRFMHKPYAYVEPGKAAAERLGLDHLVIWDEFEPFVDRRLAEEPNLVIRGTLFTARTNETPSVLSLQSERQLWESVLKTRWPKSQFGPMPDPIALRAIKDADEVAALRRVAASSSAALRAGLTALRPGRRQRDAEVDVLAACVRAGADGISFWPWLMTGNNSDITVAFQSLADRSFLDRVMSAGEMARVDVGCAQDHYEGDVGRTAPVSGHFDEGQREAWDLFVSAYLVAMDAIKPGKTSDDVFAAWQHQFQQRRSELRTAFGKRTAEVALSKEGRMFCVLHGVGLDSGEGVIDKLSVGQVLAFEPILTVDGVGLYLEDMILVTPAGAEVLTKGLPYTSFEIEAAVRSR
jgi:Xaa-Pro aminopeptidase